MNKIKKKPVLLFAIILIVLYVIIYISPKVTGVFMPSYTAEYGDLKISDDTSGYIVRNEKVYVSGNGGSANRYIKEGTLALKGTTVMEVTGNSDKSPSSKLQNITETLGKNAVVTTDYSLLNGGIVCYYADGYENTFTPENIDKKSYDSYDKLTQKDVQELSTSSVAKGQPVFKVVDRTRWFIVCFVSEKNKERYTKGESVKLEFNDNDSDKDTDNSVEAEVYKTDISDGKCRVILSTDNYYRHFADTRVADVSLVTSDVRGLIIYNSSICEKDGKKGVYIRSLNSSYKFVPIQILSSDDEKSVITDTYFYDEKGKQYSTVEPYDEVLKNAK